MPPETRGQWPPTGGGSIVGSQGMAAMSKGHPQAAMVTLAVKVCQVRTAHRWPQWCWQQGWTKHGLPTGSRSVLVVRGRVASSDNLQTPAAASAVAKSQGGHMSPHASLHLAYVQNTKVRHGNTSASLWLYCWSFQHYKTTSHLQIGSVLKTHNINTYLFHYLSLLFDTSNEEHVGKLTANVSSSFSTVSKTYRLCYPELA